MKRMSCIPAFFVVLCCLFLVNCLSLPPGEQQKALYDHLASFMESNDYMVFCYTPGKVIDGFTYTVESTEIKTTGWYGIPGTETDYAVTVKIGDETAASIFSTDQGNTYNKVAVDYRTQFPGTKIVKIDDEDDLKKVYIKMLNGE
jgi:hypothetical protein